MSLAYRTALFNGVAFSPRDLFRMGEQGWIYDATISDLSGLFQDSAGTTPVTAVEQPVGKMNDTSGRGNHATQATSAARPTLSARYNLLTKTEQFDDAAWVKTGATVSADATTAPDGTTTADKLQETVGGTLHSAEQTFTVASGVRQRLVVHAKAAERNWIAVGFGTNPLNGAAFFDLQNGAVGTRQANNLAATITSVGDGWYRCLVEATTASTFGNGTVYVCSADNTASYSGTAGSGVFLWGADLRPANDGVGLPAYQRVNTATDYDTTGFPLYLNFLGTDDNMVLPVAISTLGFTAFYAERMTGPTGANGRVFFIGDNTGNTNQLSGTHIFAGYRWPENEVVALGADVISSRITTYQRASTTSQNANTNGVANTPNTNSTTTFTSATGRIGCNLSSSANAQFFVGRVYFPFVGLGRLATAGEITNMETYLNTRNKVY